MSTFVTSLLDPYTPEELADLARISSKQLLDTLNFSLALAVPISNETYQRILEKVTEPDPELTSISISQCLTGVKMRLGENSPYEAEQWARLAVDLSKIIPDANEILKTNVSKAALSDLITLAALRAVDYHNQNIENVKSALETAQQLRHLHQHIMKDHHSSDLSFSRM